MAPMAWGLCMNLHVCEHVRLIIMYCPTDAEGRHGDQACSILGRAMANEGEDALLTLPRAKSLVVTAYFCHKGREMGRKSIDELARAYLTLSHVHTG